MIGEAHPGSAGAITPSKFWEKLRTVSGWAQVVPEHRVKVGGWSESVGGLVGRCGREATGWPGRCGKLGVVVGGVGERCARASVWLEELEGVSVGVQLKV